MYGAAIGHQWWCWLELNLSTDDCLAVHVCHLSEYNASLTDIYACILSFLKSINICGEESHARATDSHDSRASRPWRPSAHADLLFGRMHNRDAAIFGRIGTWTSHTCLADSGDAACLKMKMYLHKSHNLNNKDAFDYRINHLGLNVCSPCWPMNFQCLRYTRLQPSHYSLEMTRKFKLFVTVCCVCFTMSDWITDRRDMTMTEDRIAFRVIRRQSECHPALRQAWNSWFSVTVKVNILTNYLLLFSSQLFYRVWQWQGNVAALLWSLWWSVHWSGRAYQSTSLSWYTVWHSVQLVSTKILFILNWTNNMSLMEEHSMH